MKKIVFPLLIVSVFACARWNAPKQTAIRVIDETKKPDTSVVLPPKQIPGDPLQVKEYTLENGLKIFISENHEVPRIQTLVIVKSGSVNDPATATGLAHYLEHMLFKGNDKIGTINYEAEKVEIDKIKALFEVLRSTKDTLERKKIYHKIDSISGVAAQYACPNEIDQLFAQIGAEGTNAFTGNEYTGYINDIPSNQLENWLKIETQRYTNPVLRLFHTELEAVYEEKNISLDNGDRMLYYEFMSAIFPTHNYGQQTTIGTVEHLKSPSLVEIEKYFNAHYVPNNMAIILAGDLNPDSTVALIKQHFAHFKRKELQPYVFTPEAPITQVVSREIFSKQSEKLMMGFRFPDANSKEAIMITLVDMLLNNSTAGLMDVNINQLQKAVSSHSYTYQMKDYSLHILDGEPTKGQKLEDLQELILAQLEEIKKGNFPDWMLKAVVNDLKKRELMENRSNRQRVNKISDYFTSNIPWEKSVTYFDELSKITKQEIIDFVKVNYNNNYVVIYRRQKEGAEALKVEKPAITPVNPNPNNRSKFLSDFTQQNHPAPIQPDFVDYKKAISFDKLKDSLSLLYKHNPENSLFSLSLVVPYGSWHNRYASLAGEYLQIIGTKNLSLKELNERWYQLGIDFNILVKEEETYFSISGLSENFKEGLQLMVELLQNVQVDNDALGSLKNKHLQLRENSLKDKRALLSTGLKNYLVYEEKSPLKFGLSNEELKQASAFSLAGLLHSLFSSANKVTYFGPSTQDSIKKELLILSSPQKLSGVLQPDFNSKRVNPTNNNQIFVYHFDMQQAEMLLMCKKLAFDKKNLPVIALFNEYFGGGMSSVVFQEIREKKALAYSVYAAYTGVKDQRDPHYVLAYIGTQADKFEEALQAMTQLMSNMPIDTAKFLQAKESLKQQYASKRIPPHAIIGNYLNDSKIGYDYDNTRDLYLAIDALTITDIQNFFNNNIKNTNYRIAILGNTSILKPELLKKYGEVKVLNAKNLFPY